jgi:hypothetical protein
MCYDGAKLFDKHLASTIHCVDDEIIEWLKRREQLTRHLALAELTFRILGPL